MKRASASTGAVLMACAGNEIMMVQNFSFADPPTFYCSVSLQ